MYTQ
jgi:hypothetical protein